MMEVTGGNELRDVENAMQCTRKLLFIRSNLKCAFVSQRAFVGEPSLAKGGDPETDTATAL